MYLAHSHEARSQETHHHVIIMCDFNVLLYIIMHIYMWDIKLGDLSQSVHVKQASVGLSDRDRLRVRLTG